MWDFGTEVTIISCWFLTSDKYVGLWHRSKFFPEYCAFHQWPIVIRYQGAVEEAQFRLISKRHSLNLSLQPVAQTLLLNVSEN